MYPHPTHFIIRNPGGRIVPLIAVDQLPDWMQLAGVPRELGAQQAAGMTNLGHADDGGNGDVAAAVVPYEVHLRADRIRAILSGREEEGGQSVGSSSLSSSTTATERGGGLEEGEKKKRKKKKKKRGMDRGKGRDVAVLPPHSRVDGTAIEASIMDLDSGRDSDVAPPGSPMSIHVDQEAAAKDHHTQQTIHQGSILPKHTLTAEPMLNASRHNTTAIDSALNSSISSTSHSNKQTQPQQAPIPRHMTEEMSLQDQESYHHQQHQRQHQPHHITGRSTIKEITPTTHPHPHHRLPGVHGGNQDTLFCRHWCRHGTCKWGWACRYQHRMPTDAEGLRDVGLRDFPTWYLLLIGGGGGINANNSSSDRQVFPSRNGVSTARTPVQHHLADALLSGPAGGGVGGGNMITTTAPRQQQQQQQQHISQTTHRHHHQRHHPSPTELRLIQARMSDLLPGSTTMSNKQKRKQIREMQQLFLRPSSLSLSSLVANNNGNNHDHDDHHKQQQQQQQLELELELELELTRRDGGDGGRRMEREMEMEMGRVSPLSGDDGAGGSVREGRLVDVD